MKTYRVVYEHEHFIVIDKLHGCLVHGQNTDPSETTLVQQLRNDFSDISIYPSHRLDKDTSGLMLIAKNAEANSLISTAFEHKDITKKYLALTDKKPKKKQGWVHGDMTKARNGSWKLSRSMTNPAVTYFQTLFLPQANKRLFLLAPHTGKTHQLRVAMKSLGSPILGDKRYKGASADRMYLHAYSLHFSMFEETFSFSVLPKEGSEFLEEEFIMGVEYLCENQTSLGI